MANSPLIERTETFSGKSHSLGNKVPENFNKENFNKEQEQRNHLQLNGRVLLKRPFGNYLPKTGSKGNQKAFREQTTK